MIGMETKNTLREGISKHHWTAAALSLVSYVSIMWLCACFFVQYFNHTLSGNQLELTGMAGFFAGYQVCRLVVGLISKLIRTT